MGYCWCKTDMIQGAGSWSHWQRDRDVGMDTIEALRRNTRKAQDGKRDTASRLRKSHERARYILEARVGRGAAERSGWLTHLGSGTREDGENVNSRG